MIEFIQANASWLVLGALFVLMMRMHGSGGGMGCGGGHQHGGEQKEPRSDQKTSLPEPKAEDGDEEKTKEPVATGNNRHSGGCH